MSSNLSKPKDLALEATQIDFKLNFILNKRDANRVWLLAAPVGLSKLSLATGLADQLA